MLNPELSAFSRFFEIQPQSKEEEAEKSHSKYIAKLSEMRKSPKLDQNKEEIGKVKNELMESGEIEGDKISGKTRKLSNSISSIDKRSETIKIESNSERNLLKNFRSTREYLP